MSSLYIIVICIVAISLAIIATIQTRLRKRSKEISAKINHISSFNNDRFKTQLSQLNEDFFVDIPSDIEKSFRGQIISTSQAKEFTHYYAYFYQEAKSLVRKLEIFRITPSSEILKFIKDFGSIDTLVRLHNNDVAEYLLDTHKEFFDTCLKYPLDNQQRRSIISEEDNCLVVSSAGSGKTSSIVGKVKYLTEIQGVDPKRILLISYTNKAAAELTERIAIDGIRGYTFHKLAIDIIGQVTGVKPSICDNTDALFVKIYQQLLHKPSFLESVVKYFLNYQFDESYKERLESEKRQQLSERKQTRLKALFPDMDGKLIYVRSEQELKICSALFALGVRFRYEEPYEYQVANERYSQYRPDFSIYYEQDGEQNRIYLEHFGVDEKGFVPMWFAQENNMTYAEANKQYNDGITWKKFAHEKYGTKLLVTSSADFKKSDIKEVLKTLLIDVGVPICERSEEELYAMVLPKGSKQEKAFIRLVITFITLLKSSCKTIKEVLQQVQKQNDYRGEFIIRDILIPVYEEYNMALKGQGQLDFTDIILQATEICRTQQPYEYDYIIVDEFQDISLDRYNFLKVLREGVTSAKLYCVGDDWQSIYRFSGSDMALFNQFACYFGPTEINKIETTYRFGEPLVSISSRFIQCNKSQIQKNIKSANPLVTTGLGFYAYDKNDYNLIIEQIISSIPADKSVFLLGRYSFDDYYLSSVYKSYKEGSKFYYLIGDRKIEFLTVHKSKGLEADYVILLQCNRDIYGFPSLVSDDPILNYVLTASDQYPFGEERRLFYVAITRSKIKTIILYDKNIPSVFVDEFLNPQKVTEESEIRFPNANKRWTYQADNFLMQLYREGKSIKYIAEKMGRSLTSIAMRLNKLKDENL